MKTLKASGSKLPLPSSASPQGSPPSTDCGHSPLLPPNLSSSSIAKTTRTSKPPTSLRSMERSCTFVRNAPLLWQVTVTALLRCIKGRTSSPLHLITTQQPTPDSEPISPYLAILERQRYRPSYNNWRKCVVLSSLPNKILNRSWLNPKSSMDSNCKKSMTISHSSSNLYSSRNTNAITIFLLNDKMLKDKLGN